MPCFENGINDSAHLRGWQISEFCSRFFLYRKQLNEYGKFMPDALNMIYNECNTSMYWRKRKGGKNSNKWMSTVWRVRLKFLPCTKVSASRLRTSFYFEYKIRHRRNFFFFALTWNFNWTCSSCKWRRVFFLDSITTTEIFDMLIELQNSPAVVCVTIFGRH